MKSITWDQFELVELRVGTVLEVIPFPEARKPAYKLKIDFGELGIRSSSAQITTLYAPENLIGSQVVVVLNLAPKRIAGFVSECLVTGFANESGDVVVIRPTSEVPNGAKLF